jgi:hypothetical protein
MRLLNKNFCGPETGKIQIRYHDGTGVKVGYIVRPFNWLYFIVSTDGINTAKVRLAQTEEAATNLQPGYATIRATLADGSTTYIKKLPNGGAVTTTGKAIGWATKQSPMLTTGDVILETRGIDPADDNGAPAIDYTLTNYLLIY